MDDPLMGTGEGAPVRPIRNGVSWFLGGIATFLGFVGVLSSLWTPDPKGFAAGLALLFPGVIALPPVIAQIRRRGFLKSSWTHVGVGVLGYIALTLLSAKLPDKMPVGTVSDGGPPPTAVAPNETRTVDASAVLPPANRFKGVPEGDTLRPVQDKLNAGEVDEAVLLFYARPVTVEKRKTEQGRALDRALDKAFSEVSGGQTKGSTEVERLGSYWRPQLEAIPITEPATAEDIWARAKSFDDLGRALHDSEIAELAPGEKRQRDAFRVALAAKQAKVFPLLRKAYVGLVEHGLWLNNVDAEVRGERASTLHLTGGVFASNRNVDEMQRANAGALRKLRFTGSEYAWHKGSEAVRYTLHSPNDQAIGYTEGDSFIPVR
jgi:hypothetical protein